MDDSDSNKVKVTSEGMGLWEGEGEFRNSLLGRCKFKVPKYKCKF